MTFAGNLLIAAEQPLVTQRGGLAMDASIEDRTPAAPHADAPVEDQPAEAPGAEATAQAA